MSAPTLPRYHARSLSGWKITKASLARESSGYRQPPTLWQVQDSWDCWRVVDTLSRFDAGAQAEAERRADDLNWEHEHWLAERGLL